MPLEHAYPSVTGFSSSPRTETTVPSSSNSNWRPHWPAQIRQDVYAMRVTVESPRGAPAYSPSMANVPWSIEANANRGATAQLLASTWNSMGFTSQ